MAVLLAQMVYHGATRRERRAELRWDEQDSGMTADAITVGLDVGGAHLKVALAEGRRIAAVEQIACPLWLGMEHLERALAKARTYLARADAIAVTMTGELSDLFMDRRDGVAQLVYLLSEHLGSEARFWMGARGLGDAEAAICHHADVASTNFLATAALVGRHHPDALLVDMGSTTTDIIPIRGGQASAVGLTDAERLATQELVYTGLTRTAVMAVATSAPFKGVTQGLCREYFASMADVRRILGSLPPGVDLMTTADGRGKSVPESIARFARMFGRDAGDGSNDEWRDAAAAVAAVQQQSIEDGFRQVRDHAELWQAPVIAAGIGAFVVADVAASLGHPVTTFGALVGAEGEGTARATACAPAVALALLAN